MRKLKALVFDIGDTIYPSSRIRLEALKEVMRKYGLPDSFLEKYFLRYFPYKILLQIYLLNLFQSQEILIQLL